MKKNDIKNLVIYFGSLSFIYFAYYFHNGFMYIVNDIIYADEKIPPQHKENLYYFMQEKRIFKDITAISLVCLSTTFYFISIKNQRLAIKIVLTVQLMIVVFSALKWFLFKGYILG